jgi:hypothetical protein
MNAPHHQLDLADVPEADGETLLKFVQECSAEIQRRAASSQCGDFLRIKVAADVVGRSPETIRRWIRHEPSLGKHTPGGLVISASRLMERCARS